MKAHPKRTTACPLAAVDQRLADSHRFWHQAEAAYFDPDGFRLGAQSAIQTLRSVTFIVQKNKSAIPGFEKWYGDWQTRLRGDALMRWIVEARNRIEKEGDLEAYSYVRAEIIASYVDVGPRIEVPAKLFQNPAALLRNIPAGAVGEHIWRNGVLRLQRRWVENTLPDYELLDGLAIAFGKIAELVHDAHRQIGLSPPETIHDDGGERFDLPAMGWRMPCMIAHEVPRTLSVALSDGARIEFEEKTISKKVTKAEVADFLANLPNDPRVAMTRDYKNYNELAAGYFEMFRAVFLKDRYHISILFLFRDMKLIKHTQIRVENVQQKYLLMRHLAHEVTKTGADAAMLVGESWIAPAESLRGYERPADSPLRKEALSLDLVSKSGEPIDCMAIINRDGDNVSLGETVTRTSLAVFEFAPFYDSNQVRYSGLTCNSTGLSCTLAAIKALPLLERERLLGGNWKIRPAAGLYFKREWCAVVDQVPADLEVVRYWDLAATEKTELNDPDWTVGVKLGRDDKRGYWLLDVVRARANPGDVERLLLEIAARDGKRVRIGFGQDPGQAGKSQALHLVRALSGYTVTPAPESGDKLTRFGPFSSQSRAGNVKILRGPWNEDLFRVLEGFPDLAHDDEADACSGASKCSIHK